MICPDCNDSDSLCIACDGSGHVCSVCEAPCPRGATLCDEHATATQPGFDPDEDTHAQD